MFLYVEMYIFKITFIFIFYKSLFSQNNSRAKENGVKNNSDARRINIFVKNEIEVMMLLLLARTMITMMQLLCILEPEVRFSVLVSLDEKFDPHLAQAENLAALFIALKDEVFEIRELAVCIIGRLCVLNPAHVMPFLRKMLIEVCRPSVLT